MRQLDNPCIICSQFQTFYKYLIERGIRNSEKSPRRLKQTVHFRFLNVQREFIIYSVFISNRYYNKQFSLDIFEKMSNLASKSEKNWQYQYRNFVILINDLLFFCCANGPFKPENWPKIERYFSKVKQIKAKVGKKSELSKLKIRLICLLKKMSVLFTF